MFGKKAKKQAELEALEKRKQAIAARQAEIAAQQRQRDEDNKVYYESEIIADGDDDVMEIELVPDTDDKAAQNNGETDFADVLPVETEDDDVQELTLEETEEEPVNEIEEVEEPVVEEEPDEEEEEPVEDSETDEGENTDEPEVRYVMDGPTEDDEIVKPAKLVKLPNLIDYMLSLKMSKRMKMNIATLLLGAYAKFKDIPAEKEILIGCMKKLMFSLMNEH